VILTKCEVMYGQRAGGTEENIEKRQLGLPVSGPRFEPEAPEC
jgi:hypothetical protein